MEGLRFNKSDVQLHVARYGIDTYPQIVPKDERTRLNMFFEEAARRWPDLFGDLSSGETSFKISKRFGAPPGTPGVSFNVDTFVLIPRGPVFAFPLCFPELGPTKSGANELEENHREVFGQVRELFFSAIGERKTMRLGLIREIVLQTGDEQCTQVLAQETEFAKAKLTGGSARFTYHDEMCNIHVVLEPVQAHKNAQLATGATVREAAGYGLRVMLDVNNRVSGELKDADIEQVLDRADSLWPDKLLEYLNGRKPL